MVRFYVVALVLALVAGAYVAGGGIAREKCATQNAAVAATKQIQIIQQIEKINAEVFNTATDDIRRRLREKYTIVQ